MRAVLVVLCVALGATAAGGDSEAAPASGEQWAPFFSEASRASEGLPWGAVSPAADQDPAASSHRSDDRGDAKQARDDRKDVHKVTLTKNVHVPYTVHVEKRIPKIIEVPVDKPFNVYVPKPYPVIVEKKVPYEIKVHQPQPYTVEKRVPYPVKVLVDKPYTVHVPKPYPVDVEKKYEFTVEKKIPYEVKVPVERPYPVHMIVEKEVKFPVEKKVPVPVKVPYEKPIPIHVTKHVPVSVDKPVPYTVEKVTTYPVKVPFRIPIKLHYPEGGNAAHVHGEVQNSEWAEAMNSVTNAAKFESRPAQWHGAQYWQAESLRPSQWQEVSHRQILQGQAESRRPSQQWQDPSQRPSQGYELLQRPSQVQAPLLRPTHVRQGFSSGRGLPNRNSYLLSKHSFRMPATKLQPVSHHYEVSEAMFEQPSTAPYLTRPGSHVIVPQMILSDSPPHKFLLQQSNSLSSGAHQPSLQSSGFQQPSVNSEFHQSNLPKSGWLLSNSPSGRLQQSISTNSGMQRPDFLYTLHQTNTQNSLQQPSNPNPSANPVSSPQPLGNAIPMEGLSSFLDHQNNTAGSQSYSITNVIHHTGGPSRQTVVNHRANPDDHPQKGKLHYLTQNALVSDPSLSSPTFFNPPQNHSSFGTRTTENPLPSSGSALPYSTSGFTISYKSPAIAQPQSRQQPGSAPPQVVSQPLFKPSASTQQAQNADHVSSSHIDAKTAHDGQKLTYTTSIHLKHDTPNKPEQTYPQPTITTSSHTLPVVSR